MNKAALSSIDSLMTLAHRAKDVRDYPTANTVVGILIQLWVDERTEGLFWEYEIQWDGDDPYYHLLVACTQTGNRLCIPRPLVALEWFQKLKVEIVGREDHRRETKTGASLRAELEELISELGITIPDGIILEAGSPDGSWMTTDEVNSSLERQEENAYDGAPEEEYEE
jgi:hypothetical protein